MDARHRRVSARRLALRRVGAAAVAVALIGGVAFALTRDDSDDPLQEIDREPAENPLSSACSLPPKWVERIKRGYDPVHSEDITMVADPPHYPGNFAGPSHSGPWNYLQQVPFVLYGPGIINETPEPVTKPIATTSWFSTVGEMVGVELPKRDGEILEEALAGDGIVPKVVVVVVWDGVGRNVLNRWPDAWPRLAALEADGTSYLNAIVGSSPSITPATHSTLGTGTFPQTHGVTGIEYRKKNGEMGSAFSGSDTSQLRKTTYADLIDKELGNAPLVGLVGSVPWHLGMMGHGTITPGGDADTVVYIGKETLKDKDLDSYRTTSTPLTPPDMDTLVEELDLEDGTADNRWLEREIDDPRKTPALVRFQTEVVLQMLEQEGYGADEVTDMFFVNFKTGDTIGHQYSMDAPEMEEVIRAQDEGLAEIIEYLETEVGEFALLVTADHGHTPTWESSGGWPIDNTELIVDIDREFGAPEGKSLVEDRVAVGFFMNEDVMDEVDVSLKDVAAWMDGYTLQENWPEGELPEAFAGRGEERLFSAVFPTDEIPEVVECVGAAEGTDAVGD